LTHAFDEMKLSDDTLVVITGAHGEAFGEHGQYVHNFTVYDEEVRVPLLLINKQIFHREFHVKELGRQIDIVPTMLALLGYNEPSSWQGRSLLGGTGADRAYLFSGNAEFIFGLVERNFKYIYNSDRSGAELYDLATDSTEAHDLSSDPSKSVVMKEDQSRIATWISFQNKYLQRFGRP
jgi:lipoteichoic acid synthase